MDENKKKNRTMEIIAIAILNPMDFLGFMAFIGHFGNCNFGIPPQSLALPINNITLVFPKTPSVGTSPSKLLNERFYFSKRGSFSKPFGMDPDRLF